MQQLLKEVIISFLGPLIGGEPGFISLAFLSAGGYVSIWLLFLMGTIANVLRDLFFYSLPNNKFLKKVKIPKFILKKFDKKYKKIKKVENKETLLIMIGSKFIYGTRTVTLLSMGVSKIKLSRFILDSFFSSALLSIFLILIGWGSGKGFFIAKDIINNIKILVVLLLIIIAIIILIRHRMHHHTKRILHSRKY
ncbi:MAG: hypothetical protein WC867_02640 [Candidatus Pacearchaeota archaeon]|jgi:membrane protein DedA with SNARE-associated domain